MEGPSLVILREELQRFRGKRIQKISGNTKQPKEDLQGKVLKDIETWGKTIYLIFSGNIVTKTHFLMFGSYRIDEPKENRFPRVEFVFPNGTVYFYACAFQMDAGELLKNVDHRVDVLSEEWDERFVLKELKKKMDPYLCDLLLDQTLFSGSGNIVKNEVLFNLRRYPLTRVSELETKDLKKIVHAVRVYCEHFYEWKKRFELRKHWQVYKRINCRNCQRKLRRDHMGKGKRSTFYCPHCQSKKNVLLPLKVHPVLPVEKGGKKEKVLDH